MSKSNIEWTNETWNCVTGCTRVSAGCDNCYAVTMTKRLEAMGQSKYEGLVNIGKSHFNGVVKAHDDALLLPFSWKKPRRVFVNSMSDLFHKDVPFEFIDKVMAVIALNPQHTFQVLTKRPERMAEYFNECSFERGYSSVFDEIEEMAHERFGDIYELAHKSKTIHVYPVGDSGDYGCDIRWPLPNLWLGTSVENQETANERIPHLLQCPAAVRFLSCEPLLGDVSLAKWLDIENYRKCLKCYGVGPDGPECSICGQHSFCGPALDWIIVGGESGPNARPMNPDWARDIRDQCVAAGVAYFHKQNGEYAPGEIAADLMPRTLEGVWMNNGGEYHRRKVYASEELYADEEPTVYHVGKKAAGRLLDGRTWDEFPEVRC